MGMDAKGIPADTHGKIYPGITRALVCAVLEWLLLSMLFVDAVFAFIITRYARFYKLQPPCLLCSRLDHVLGREKRGFYWDLICGNHKSEISSLVISHAHNKLVDVHQIRESQLSSSATISKSNAETCRLLEDHDSCCDQNKLLEACQPSSPSSSSANDSCCSEPLTSERYGQQLIQAKSIVFEAIDRDVPSSDAAAAGSTDNEIEQTKTDPAVSLGAASSPSSSSANDSCCSEPLTSERHGQQLIQAKSIVFEAIERDVPSSDAATAGSTDNEMEQTKTDPSVSLGAAPSVDSGFGSELKAASDPRSEVSFLNNDEEIPIVCETDTAKDLEIQHVQLEPLVVTVAEDSSTEQIDRVSVTDPSLLEPQVKPVDSCGALPEVSAASNDNDLEELNWQQAEGKNEPSSIPELISFDVAPPLSDGATPPVEVSTLSNGATFPVEVSNETSNVTTSAIEQESVLVSEKVCEPETVVISRAFTSSGPQSSNLMDLGDAYKVALESKEKQLSDVVAEPWTERSSSKVNADFRRLLSQLSAARGFDQSIYDISPRLSSNDDVANSIGMHMFQKRISLERNESGLSMDGSIVSIVSEVDGESLVDRLRRQVEHDRKSMSVLYKELEEERNASAIAANQAMAMITKLQEEKAALNMEASQYLRMMEEQSEYDTETLQKLTDLLAEKEKEIQDLEEELEFYKRKYPNESRMENSEVPEDESIATVAKSLLDFEDESSYILHSLKKLEKKLLLFSNNGVHSELDCSQYAEDQSLPSTVDLKSVNKENDDLIRDLASIRNEVYDLNDRLRTLEADRSFLEHAINSLRNGNEGVQFIQEIASHLRELRKIGKNRRDQSHT